MMPEQIITLDSGVRIGHDQPCFIVAEIGNNHQGDMDMARVLIREAARVGVDAVKFQKRNTRALLTDEGMAMPYTSENSFGATYGEHRNALELSAQQMGELKRLSEAEGLTFFVSVWDTVSLTEMQELGLSLFKMCSADLVNVPLLRMAGALQTPLILSTGMNTLDEIDYAVTILKSFHNQIVLLHCNSTYPCEAADIGLPVMRMLAERHGLPTGYSGHEFGLGPSVAAVAVGACVLERHFTLDRSLRGNDHKSSLNPTQFQELVVMVRDVEQSLQLRKKVITSAEILLSHKLRKSIVAACDLAPGVVLRDGHLTTKSPGTGISPRYWDRVHGATLLKPLRKDQMLQWEMLQWPNEP